MNEDGEAMFFAKLVYFEATVVVDLKVLDIGVELNAVQTERHKVFEVGGEIGAIGVKSTETDKRRGVKGHLLGDKVIYALHLFWCSSDRLNDKFIDACGFSEREEVIDGSCTDGNLAVKIICTVDCTF